MLEIVEKLKSEYGELINFGASAVFMYNDGLLFSLVKKSKWRIDQAGESVVDFSGIGGGIENGESPYDCLIREIHEEVGLGEGECSFSDSGFTRILAKGQLIEEIKNYPSQQPQPIIVSVQEVPEKNRSEKPQKFTHIALFVYLVRVETMPVLREPDLPGLVYFSGSARDYLSDRTRLRIPTSPDSKVQVFPNLEFGELPPVIVLEPKFTPASLALANLEFSTLKSLFR